MKKLFKILGIIVAGFVVIIVAAIVYFNAKYPDVEPASNVKVGATPQMIVRGQYLANHVTLCTDCHSQRDWTKYSGPVIPATLGKGGEEFNQAMLGIPGTIYAYNITPAGVGNWTDGELIRAITQGVTKDNKALFPIMPYMGFNHLSKTDLYSIVAYLRTLKSIENKIPERHLTFPMNFIVKTIPPKTYTPAPEPDTSDHLAYGKYLVTIAGCADCHTQQVKGQFVEKMAFAGGFVFNLPWGTVRSANITPDDETGIGKWSKEQFINFFKSFVPDSVNNMPVKPGTFNTIMPISQYAGMTREDLGDIYTYLRTLKPVNNKVSKFTPKKD